MKAIKSLLVFGVVATLNFTLMGCGGGNDGGAGNFNKPEDAFNAFTEAVKKDDWKTASQYMTQESQEVMAGSLVTGAIRMKQMSEVPGLPMEANLKDNLKKIDTVLDKHGITEAQFKEWKDQKLGPTSKENLLKFAEPIEDEPAFIGDMMTVMKEIQKDKDASAPPDAKLTDVQIDGDTATGKMVFTINGEEKTDPVNFRKEKGGWRIHLAEDMPGM